MGKKRILIGFLVVIVILVGITLMAGLFYWRGSQATADQYILRTLLVNLTRPLNGSAVHLGEVIPVAAEANGLNPIKSLEFWVDEKLMDRTDTQNPELKQLNGFWNWVPDKEGQFALSIRGRDSIGQTVMSNMAFVTVGPAEPVVRQVLLKDGETLTNLAEKFNMDVGAIADHNPGIDPTAPLTGDKPVDLPVPAGNTLLVKSFGKPNPEELPTNPTPPVPTPPLPDLDPDKTPPFDAVVTLELIGNCNIKVSVKAASGNAEGFRVYMWRPASGNVPSMVQTHGPMAEGESFDYVENNVYGFYRVIVEAFNGNGVSSSKQANLGVYSEACLKNAKPSADMKVITRRTMSKLFCYVTIDEKAFIHVPLPSDSYINSMKKADLDTWAKKVLPNAQLAARSGFDITSHLPVIYPKFSGTSHIKFECWDWDGQVKLGTVEKDATKDELKTIIIMSCEDFDVVGIFGVSLYGDSNEVQISAPFNFKPTLDSNLCAKHENLAMCETLIKNGMMAYVWDYTQQKCLPGTEAWCHFTDIDGFRIYQHYKTGKPPQWAYAVGGKEKVTAGYTQWPTQPECNNLTGSDQSACLFTNSLCFSVRAYKGSIESHDSNVICLSDQSDGTGTITKLFTPSHKGNVLLGYPNPDPVYWNDLFAKADLEAGFIDIDNLETGYKSYYFFYGLFMFDLDEIKGKPVISATLLINKKETSNTINFATVPGFNCVKHLGVIKKPPFIANYLADEYISNTVIHWGLPEIENGEINIDVTNTIKAWSQGQPNVGFILIGEDPNLFGGPYLHECMNTFDDFKLDVTYFPS